MHIRTYRRINIARILAEKNIKIKRYPVQEFLESLFTVVFFILFYVASHFFANG